MSVLKAYFSKKVNQQSRVVDDYARVVNYDEDGNEFITYSKVDYKKIQDSLGTVSDWNLDTLLKAGINPDFPVHTGYNTRLQGIDVLQQFGSLADSILEVPPIDDNSNNNNE